MANNSEARQEALGAFVRGHPGGWHHGEWERLVGELIERGLASPGEEDAVGRELEKERVRQTLGALDVPGLGPKRRAAVADAFPSLWDLRRANAGELARLPSMNGRIAAATVAALR